MLRRGIGKKLARMHSGVDLFGSDLDGRLVCGEIRRKIYLARINAVGGNVPMIPHTAEEHVRSAVKAARVTCHTVVPFADAHGVIARTEKALAHRRVTLGYVFAAFLKVEKRFARIEHGTARHADSRGGAARYVRIGERHAAPDEKVKVRRAYFVVAECVYRAVSLIVGEQEQYVRLLSRI